MEPVTGTARLAVRDPTQVAEARRTATAIAAREGFDELHMATVALVVTELATNLIKHGRGGDLLVRPVFEQKENALEIISLDKGEGIANIPAALRDGTSTSGTAGTGLGSIVRHSTTFDVYSSPESGTVVLTVVPNADPASRGRRTGPAPPTAVVGAVSVAVSGEEVCGDAWMVTAESDRIRTIVCDGLGHGALAAEAAHAAVGAIASRRNGSIVSALESANDALRSTRGAAVAVADLDTARGVLRYCGVGNINGAIVHSRGRTGLVSSNGTVGHAMPRAQEFSYPWPERALLVMHSDGIQGKWDLSRYAGLTSRHPSVIAAVLYRDFVRGRDDATVVVVKTTGDSA
jgi:anti-sigma regulatory factor (Ser/Thr protein kinase)